MVQGGIPPMRPDQALQPRSRAGTGPAPQQGIVQARQVIVSGGSPEGVFVYAAGTTPSLGNPPIVSITNGTTDPFGNTVIPGLDVTTGAITGITITGTTISGSTFNGTDFVINSKGSFFYSGAPALGDLMVAIAPAAGTDTFTNPFIQGVQIKSPGSLQVIGVGGQKISLQFSGSSPVVFLATGAPEETNPANFQAFIINPGASEFMSAFFEGPKGTAPHSAFTDVNLSSDAKDGSGSGASGTLNLIDASAVTHQFLRWDKNGVAVTNPNSGDNNTYQTERLTVVPSAPLTVNQTTFTQQVMSTISLGVGTYHLHGQISITPAAAAGAAQFEFGGGTSVATMRIIFREYNTIAAGGAWTTENGSEVTAFASAFTGNTFGANDRTVEFDGTMVVTTSGLLGLFAATTVAVDTFVINQLGTYMELNPVGPA